jgi:HEAT repeat protein
MSADTLAIPDPPLVNWLVALSHDSPLEAHAPDARRGTSPPLTAVPSLLSLLKDPDRNVRRRTALAAGNLAREVRWVLPALRTALEDVALHDADDSVRSEAVEALLQAGPQPATEVAALEDALHSALDVVRFHAALALGDLGPVARSAVPALIHVCSWDEELSVRVGAAMALWKIDERRVSLVLHVLTEALANENELICRVAAENLAQMGSEASEAVPALREALRRSYRHSIVPTSVRLALDRIEAQTRPITE